MSWWPQWILPHSYRAKALHKIKNAKWLNNHTRKNLVRNVKNKTQPFGKLQHNQFIKKIHNAQIRRLKNSALREISKLSETNKRIGLSNTQVNLLKEQVTRINSQDNYQQIVNNANRAFKSFIGSGYYNPTYINKTLREKARRKISNAYNNHVLTNTQKTNLNTVVKNARHFTKNELELIFNHIGQKLREKARRNISNAYNNHVLTNTQRTNLTSIVNNAKHFTEIEAKQIFNTINIMGENRNIRSQ